jgi:ATP-binding protein involved in chromosome partitioning
MKIAIPLANGVLSAHFGHCEKYAVIEVDDNAKTIIKSDEYPAPPHNPGVIPEWLGRLGCHMVIAGGMGHKAIDLFRQKGITVVLGATPQRAEEIVMNYLKSELTTANNPCERPEFHESRRGQCQSPGENR